MNELLQPTKPIQPKYIPPIITEWTPKEGEYITRPIGSIQLEQSYDAWAIQSGRQTEKYGYTALHPVVQPALKFLVEGPFWTEWHFHEVNDYKVFPQFEAIDQQIMEMLDYQIDMFKYETFENTLKSIWKDVLVFGYSISEMNFRYDERYWCMDSIKTHSPFLFDLYSDKGNMLSKVYYGLTGTSIEGPDLEKLLVITYPYIEHGNHYGQSILRSIYFDVKLVEILEQALSEGIRRLMIRPIIHYFAGQNLSEEDLNKVRAALKSLDSASVVSLPGTQNPETGALQPSHEMKVLEDRASAEGEVMVKDLLDTLYKRINRSLGLPDDLGFSTAKIGSLAKAQEEMDMYTQTIVNNQGFIEQFVNRKIVPAMIKYNFPSIITNKYYRIPQFRFGSVEEEYDTSMIQQMMDLLDAGILHPKHDLDYIREKLRLPAPSVEMIQEPEQPEIIPGLPGQQIGFGGQPITQQPAIMQRLIRGIRGAING